jgi:hypothetical protein
LSAEERARKDREDRAVWERLAAEAEQAKTALAAELQTLQATAVQAPAQLSLRQTSQRRQKKPPPRSTLMRLQPAPSLTNSFEPEAGKPIRSQFATASDRGPQKAAISQSRNGPRRAGPPTMHCLWELVVSAWSKQSAETRTYLHTSTKLNAMRQLGRCQHSSGSPQMALSEMNVQLSNVISDIVTTYNLLSSLSASCTDGRCAGLPMFLMPRNRPVPQISTRSRQNSGQSLPPIG